MQKLLDILQKEIHINGTINGIYEYWKEQVTHLEKKDVNVNVFDYDGTLFGRKDQLETNPDLAKNRGDDGIRHYMQEIGLSHFTSKYFEGVKIPDDITSNINYDYDVIISMGLWEAQYAKINANPDLIRLKKIFISKHEAKIIELIRYVIFELKFIPKSITVYEDRPELFIEFREFIEKVLGCKLKIIHVLLYDNKKYDIWKEV